MERIVTDKMNMQRKNKSTSAVEKDTPGHHGLGHASGLHQRMPGQETIRLHQKKRGRHQQPALQQPHHRRVLPQAPHGARLQSAAAKAPALHNKFE